MEVLGKEELKCRHLEDENKQLHQEIHNCNTMKVQMAKEFKAKVDTKTGILTKIMKYRNIEKEFGQRIDKANL